MSLWGATVITNLMSAIPWVGQDIVELKKIIYIYSEAICLGTLPIIGTVHKNALRKGKNSSRLEIQEYLNIPPSFLAFFAGLVDGDGYLQITKTTKGFIAMKMVISLHLEDISTLQYINSVLKIGKLNTYPDNKSPTCKLVINRTDLQEILFPLFLYHNIFFLTETRANQFNLAMHILKKDIRTFDVITSTENVPISFELPKTPLDYTKLLFFKNWIVGFAMSEGSFFLKKNNDGCFQLKQRMHTNLFESFKLVFSTDRKIETERGLYNQFGVSSKKDVQKVIDFFSFSGLHPLVGRRLIEYLTWVDALKGRSYQIDNKKILHSGFLYSNQIIFCIIYIVCLIVYNINPEGVNYIGFSITPLVLYVDADKDKVIAIKDNRKKSGIYRWTHKESGKCYIGSAVDLGRRFSIYYSYLAIISQAKHSMIYKSLLKYGYSAFSLEILEYCDIKDTIKREQSYIDSLNPEYNILKIAGSRLGSKQSAETKAKIVLALTGHKTSAITKSKQRAARLGISHDDATRAKLKEHLTKLNQNMLAKKKGIKVTVLDLETKITTEYDSIRKAAISTGSYASVLIKHENLQLNKDYTKPFKNRYVIKINRI